MKKLLFSILLLVSVNLYALEHDNASATEGMDSETPIKIDYDKQYNEKLNLFLTKSDDIKIQLLAFNNSFEQDNNIDHMKKALKIAITPLSDKYTIYLADILCHNKQKLIAWCHQQHIHQIHREIDPENILTYLFSISNHGNIDKIQEALKEAVDKGTYIDSFFFEYVLQTTEQILLFNKINPTLFNVYSAINDPNGINYKGKVHNLKLVEKGVVPNDYMFHLNETISTINAISIEISQPISYNNVFYLCKLKSNSDSCFQIAEHFIKEKSITNQTMGSMLKIMVQMLLSVDEETINKNQKKIDDIINKNSCYALTDDVSYSQMTNKNLMKQYIIDAKNEGELEANKNLAYTVYNTEKKNGFNPSFDPKDCQ